MVFPMPWHGIQWNSACGPLIWTSLPLVQTSDAEYISLAFGSKNSSYIHFICAKHNK